MKYSLQLLASTLGAALSLGAALARPSGAAEVGPRDFAYGQRIVTAGTAAAYRFVVPLAAYADTVREDLGDLRVFNADGEVVPYSLLRLAPPAASHAPAVVLPILPRPTDTHDYLLDGRSLTGEVGALELRWAATAADYSGRVRVEAGDDTGAWHTVVTAAPTANLHPDGQTLIENRVTMPPTKAAYWRLSWVGPAPPFPLTAVMAQVADTPIDSAWIGLDIDGVADPRDPDVDTFDVAAHVPVARVTLALAQVNTASTLELASRRTPQDPWRSVATASFYRLTTPHGEERNPPLEVAVDRDRYWRARLVHGDGLARAPLRLHVEWIPNEVTFLARGHAPFLIAYGNASALDAATDLTQIPANLDIAPATLGSRMTLGGPSRLVMQAAPLSWVRAALWCVVLMGVLSFAFAALRLTQATKS